MNQEYTVKEMISQMINVFTRVTTAIFIFASLIISVANKDPVHYTFKDVWFIILIGAVSGFGIILFYLPKNPGKKMMLFLQIIYFLIINLTVMFVGKFQGWYNDSMTASVLMMEGLVVFIFVLVTIITYIFDFNQATMMNKMLQKRKICKK